MSNIVTIISEENLAKMQKNAKVLEFLNHHPRREWIKQHPFAKGVDYLPVGKVEMLLDTVFGHWNYEIIEFKQIGNSVCVHIRLTVINPVTNITIIRDGIGAVPLELEATKYKKDANGKPTEEIEKQGARHACDFEFLNRMAIMKNLPAAKSFALKDAADTLGNLFGRSLNRDKEDFVNMYTVKEFTNFNDEVRAKINSFNDKDDLLSWAGSQSNLHDDKDFEKYVQKRMGEIANGK